MTKRFLLLVVASFLALDAKAGVQWTNGPLSDPAFFPIAVWLQNPKNAERYKEAGINTYVALWRGPNEDQLATLKRAGMWLVCSQNAYGLSQSNNPTIIGWMHGDEPDNAQSLGQNKGYGPPILPSKIITDYERIKKADPTRPVLLNLGQGVAWDNYIGRGTRRNHPEDYAEYVKGCDIASFDIYPVVHETKEITGKLEYVAKGVERLRKWAGPARPVWNCIECTHISNPQAKATPAQVRSEVWMSLIHGSKGLIYFVHEFKPSFKEGGILDDEEMFAAVKNINREISELAPVLNSESVTNFVKTKTDSPVATLVKRHGKKTYLFAVNMENRPGEFSFGVPPEVSGEALVRGEARKVEIKNGEFKDKFQGYEVHQYELP